MSLRQGGVFDICGKWNSILGCNDYPRGGHSTHKAGTDVDISHRDSDGTLVDRIKLKRIIVEKFKGGSGPTGSGTTPRPFLLFESKTDLEGNMHIFLE
jgi:hypothetical protein